MACNHPKWAFKTPLKTETGKNTWLMSVYDEMSVDDAEKRTGEKLPREPGYFYLGKGGLMLAQKVRVPCGKCIGCKMDYSKAWATRCVMEATDHEANCFITLTYNETNLPKDGKLNKKHFQDFMKRLRFKIGKKVRFFAVGEYGTRSQRPHWHAIIFGYDFPDRIRLRGTDNLFISGELTKLWPFGLHSIGEMNYKTAAYCARYALKSAETGPERAPILLMSRRPGLGFSFFQSHKGSIYETDTIYLDFGGAHRASVPQYFDKLAEKEGYVLDEVKDRRIKKAEEAFTSKFKFSDKPLEEQQFDQDGLMKRRAKTLKRNL